MYARIRALREDADLKQKELAAMLNLHQTTYSDYELGRLNVPAPVLIQLAGVLRHQRGLYSGADQRAGALSQGVKLHAHSKRCPAHAEAVRRAQCLP